MENENMETVIREKATLAAATGARVEIVGLWVWATYAEKPSKETRDALKAAGFHWNFKRKIWQYAGKPCRHSPAATDEIRMKYGAVVVA